MAISKTRLGLAVLRQNFSDLHQPLTPIEAAAAAARCLYCYDAPCTRACPTHIDIPRFIRQIHDHDPLGAANTILDANVLGGSCARACPTEVLCEGACVESTLHKQPVLIGRLQRFACDAADAAGIQFHGPAAATGRRVAIIGSGPAGLSCAYELRKLGHTTHIFEASARPGGLNTHGIAGYKITTEYSLSEVHRVKSLGAKLFLKSPVGAKELQKLLRDYDAVFWAAGLGRTAPLNIPGEQTPGVWEALEFIAQTRTQRLSGCRIGRNVIVIGGGNTAIDVANAAVRLGAETVTIAYRRDAACMPAFRHEYDGALAAGVQFAWWAMPRKVLASGGKVAGVRFVRAQLQRRGRTAKLTPIKGSEFTLAADMVVKALGQECRIDALRTLPGLKLTPDGHVVVDPQTLATDVPKLYAGGDCRSGAKEEIVYAVQDGKIAASAMHDAITR
ncbi:MAG: NAD(P)-dependent oxidoreductase [Phycisphaerae bacterium]